MSIKVVGLLAALLGSDAMAQEPEAQPIWGKVTLGMTAAQAGQLYPEQAGTKHKSNGSIEIKNYSVVGACKAEVNLLFGGKGIDKIILKGNGSIGGRCSDTVLTAMASKYGEPLSREGVDASILAREGKVYVWNRPGGVTMRFKKYSDGGLGQASWELAYTTVGTDIGL